MTIEKASQESGAATARKRGIRRILGPNLVAVVISVGIAVLIRLFVFQSFFIPSGSMIPTLQIGDRIVVSKLSFDLGGVQRGDIVVFRRPAADTVDPGIEDLVKRVVGLPGETIWSSKGHVYIDGKMLSEPYLPPGDLTYHIKRQTIPKGDYFLMGDNRGDSYDSRYFGPVPGSLFIGKVVLRFYPFSRFAVL
ncbi:MAG: signal peptidase I [Actinomycetota bacterium]|nr:signal peptidase I [Actinomycetota bacterium]